MPPPENLQPFFGRSDVLTISNVPVGSDPRDWYLKDPYSVPPWISSSYFVPNKIIEHLMCKKKNSALGVKFEANRIPSDEITNMEGALHTFVAPIIPAFIHGDYTYHGGHGVRRFDSIDNRQRARLVVVSAQIQPDFEGPDVMVALAALKAHPMTGQALPDDFMFPDITTKQLDIDRLAYDITLKRHMVAHLTQEACLPSIREAASRTTDHPTSVLEDFILSPSSNLADVVNTYVRLLQGSVLSLELLFNAAMHQLCNELSALEALCPQGYVYTSDPPSIFAQEIGATVLNRLQFAALKCLASENTFWKMRVFAFNGYADEGAIALIRAALSSQPQVMVVPKHVLFRGVGGTYTALPESQGALLVIHNNSDAFGQNIETEWEAGSMDGAIGANSSAAASLKRNRTDLIANLM